MRRHLPWITALAATLLAVPVVALPRFTLEAGSRCSNCHVNPQGGGMRSGSGWYMMNTTTAGMVTWDKLHLEGIHKAESNTFLANRVTLGGDLRLQEARMGRPTEAAPGLPQARVVPMQLTPGADVRVFDSLHVAASVNLAGIYYKEVMNASIYPGQSNYDAWIRWTPQRSPPEPTPPPAALTPAGDDEFDAVPAEAPPAESPPIGLPSLRIGMLQPSVGIRHDDHTLLIHGSAANLRQPVIPAFYNDLGAEVSWEGVHWLSMEVGGFWPRNFAAARFGESAAVVPSIQREVNANKPMANARVTFWPRLDSVGMNFWAGASVLVTHNFALEGGHFGVGKTYWGSVLAEATHSKDATLQVSRTAWLVQADYPIQPWLTAEARFEQAHATPDVGAATDITAFVAGLQWLPLPMVELRPEYRYLDTSTYRLAQYTLQVHLFY